MSEAQVVELSFGVLGRELPADHGYGLYSAISHVCPELHEKDWWSLQTISGFRDGQGRIRLDKSSRMRIRLPVERLPVVNALAGRELSIGIHRIRLTVPQLHLLQPRDILKARLVVIKGFTEPDAFLEAAMRQFDALGIQAEALIDRDASGNPLRKTIKIRRFTVVGFGMCVLGLNAEDSLKLQIHGIGGKRRMGCGVFIPGPRKIVQKSA
ncbi:MAG: type I-MYXAN CRISPR-associated protein Cas6/Cmx6 [Leptospiraceae bacterium]|nr:type I-MYXAN CRISPR-associated protein Cas6/Cmx6 [Leptospiraceae bacterium]MCB1316011.1 type I-MYXAN CRISPR-associated protein Cas6/Cmx6 [Leptospiraceae bacterium]MCB1320360.1 type I-MYXAN CRISPR-associated protein Cas6/Cmx6 [Leptospiraceae bacterium]